MQCDYTEEYRSGHNEPDSKSNRSSACPLDENAHKIRLCERLTFGKFPRKLTLCSQFSEKRFSAPAVKHIRRGIEVVITGLTRNQFASNRTRVRIPPPPPFWGFLPPVKGLSTDRPLTLHIGSESTMERIFTVEEKFCKMHIIML